MLAVKERVKDEEILVNAWKEEIKVLEKIENRIPNLTTSRFIGTLDDSISKSKEKYILIEWIEGEIIIFIFILIIFFFFIFYFLF